jgi:hypothetical protein
MTPGEAFESFTQGVVQVMLKRPGSGVSLPTAQPLGCGQLSRNPDVCAS